jgi:ferrous iron transport protein B
VLTETNVRTRFAGFLRPWAVNPWTGIPLIVFALYLIYLFVGKLVAQDVVNFTETALGNQLWEPWIRGIVTRYVLPRSWLGTLLVAERAVITMTVTYLAFLLLPFVIAFYLSLALMEDSRYLPRLATLADRS